MITQSLIDAHYLVSNGWCQNAHAIDNDSNEVHIDDPNAVEFDLTTAIYKVTHQDHIEDVYASIGMTPVETLEWNNNPNRTQREVLDLLEKAINNV